MIPTIHVQEPTVEPLDADTELNLFFEIASDILALAHADDSNSPQDNSQAPDTTADSE